MWCRTIQKVHNTYDQQKLLRHYFNNEKNYKTIGIIYEYISWQVFSYRKHTQFEKKVH